jgi:hypothetical protein
VGSGTHDCGVAVGGYVTDGNAHIEAITLGAGGPPMVCAAQGNGYCTVGTSVNTNGTCGSSVDCVTDAGSGVCTAVTSTQIAHENPADGSLSATFSTNGYGGQSLGFRAMYEGTNLYTNAPTICTDLTVAAEACSGAIISIDRSAGSGAPPPGGPYDWSYTVSVHACEALYGVTAQGGTNGWAPLKDRSKSNLFPDMGSADIRNANKKNETIRWNIGNMYAGTTAHLGVVLSGSIPKNTPDCQIRYLSGPWSALFSTDGVAFTKTDYTGRVTLYVDSNGDGNPNNCAP